MWILCPGTRGWGQTPADTGRHQVQRRAEKKRARSFNELLEVDNFLEEDLAAVVDDGYG